MNNGLLGWPGSRKVLQQMCATNDLGARKFFTSSTTWVVPGGVTRIRASALGGGGAGSSGVSYDVSSGAGGGGGLFLRGWLNVTQGETLTIIVGAGGGGAPDSPGLSGGSSQIVQAGHVVMIASGGFGAVGWNTPGLDQAAYYFDGTPLVVVPGKGGGRGINAPGSYSGSGGGGGGLSAQNTAGTAYTANSVSGSGSMGMVTPGAPLNNAGVASPLGLPESGSGGGAAFSNVGGAGAQGSGGGGGSAIAAGTPRAGGNGGNGFVMIEY